ncbi:MAG: hypothetical protein NC489_14235 [Ruminococcus flavefaciens]|nr:hypothetical protein [Ruminococcus flavefaciens]
MENSLVVFIIMLSKPRYIKIARALFEKQVNVIFVMYDIERNKRDEKNILSVANVVYFRTPEEALNICKTYCPFVYHVFVEKEYEVACNLIKNKKELGKVVYSAYDLFWGYYRNSIKKSAKIAVEKEKFCLENADGICFRDWGEDFLRENSNYKIGRCVQLFDGCVGWKDTGTILNEDELSLCYVGEVRSDQIFRNEDDIRLIPMAQRCEKNRVHLHVFPSEYCGEKFNTYFKLDKELEYFHFYDPLPYQELIEIIGQFDYGIDYANENTEKKYVTQAQIKYVSMNKYFDYLDAGLPIIGRFPSKQAEMLAADGVLIKEDILSVDFEYLRKKRNDLKNVVLNKREKYNISNNIDRLIEFYREL